LNYWEIILKGLNPFRVFAPGETRRNEKSDECSPKTLKGFNPTKSN
jgi:hypothetical protein